MKIKLLPILSSLFLVALFIFIPSKVYAESADGILREREAERIERLVAELKLVIPDITSEPSPVVTFTPIKGNTIELQVNGKGFNAIQSPYQFEGLSVGKYVLDFKYVDGSDITQTFTKNLIIIPREARTQNQKLIFKKGEEVIVAGTALPFSSIDMWIISSNEILFKNTPVDEDGNWSINLSEGLACADYKILTMVKKDGFSSAVSTALNISYCTENQTAIISQGEEIDQLTLSERFHGLVEDIKANEDSIVVAVASVLTGLIIGVFYSIIRVRGMKNKVKNMLESKLEKTGFVKTDVGDSDDLLAGIKPVKTKHTKPSKLIKPKEIEETEYEKDDVVLEQEVPVDEEEPVKEEENVQTEPDDKVEQIVPELVVEPIQEEVEVKKAHEKQNFFQGLKKKIKIKKDIPLEKEDLKDEEVEVKEEKPQEEKKKPKKKGNSFSREEFLSKFQELEKNPKAPKITLTSNSNPEVFTDD
ncbi:MAG TPA: hypothetical protein PK957_03745 [Candidatus Dojkabacteria bacterium]|nr:hypothetical protein [Candidatus Dojkabacteria bacterium]HQF36934.1 hypothetical protein [Candidatus Dojkabacteria bacterium]